LLLISGLLLGGLSACHEEEAGALRVGTNVRPGYEPLYLARGLGYLDNRVRLVEYASATQVMRAFRNGAIDAAALTLDEALQLADHGQQLEVVLVMDQAPASGSIVTHRKVSGVTGLKGARVGVEGSAHEGYLLARALDQAGMSVNDVVIVQLTAEEHERAFTEERVDAVVSVEPERWRLLGGGALPVWSSTSIPGESPGLLVVRADALLRYREHLNTLLDGWFGALRYLDEFPDDSAQRMQHRLRVPLAEMPGVLQTAVYPSRAENLQMMEGDGSPLDRAAGAVSGHMADYGLLVRGGARTVGLHTLPLRAMRP
jgi:NitT/TauT family transport system substrate-binding protein